MKLHEREFPTVTIRWNVHNNSLARLNANVSLAVISTLKRLNTFPPRTMRSMLPGGLFNYFHRSVSYLASVRIQPGYCGSREQRRRKRHELRENHTHEWTQKGAAAMPWSRVSWSPERTGVRRLRSASTLRVDCDSIATVAASAATAAGPRVQWASTCAFLRNIMRQLTLPHSLGRIPTAITDRILPAITSWARTADTIFLVQKRGKNDTRVNRVILGAFARNAQRTRRR